MVIRRIKKDGSYLSNDKLIELQTRIMSIMDGLSINGRILRDGKRLRLSQLRLNKLVYHTYPFQKSGNWSIGRNQGRVIALNKNDSGFHLKVRKGRYLQWYHWGKLDNSINSLLDKLGYEASFVSSYGKLRTGLNWERINVHKYKLYK